MKTIRNKIDPVVVTDVNGRILKLNSLAISEFKAVQIGADAFDIVDADVIRKISMYSDKIDLVKTKLDKYNMAYVKSKGTGIAKRIEITLVSLEEGKGADADKRIVGLYSDGEASSKAVCIDTLDTVSTIVEELLKRKELSCRKIKVRSTDSFYAQIGNKKAELLFLTSIFVLTEICFTSDIDIEITNSGEVSFSATSSDLYMARSVQELSALYPQIKSKLVLIESVCEDENVELNAVKISKRLCLKYKIPIGSKGEVFVKNETSTLRDIISVFIDTLLGI